MNTHYTHRIKIETEKNVERVFIHRKFISDIGKEINVEKLMLEKKDEEEIERLFNIKRNICCYFVFAEAQKLSK